MARGERRAEGDTRGVGGPDSGFGGEGQGEEEEEEEEEGEEEEETEVKVSSEGSINEDAGESEGPETDE